MKKITDEQFIQAFREVVAEAGTDYVYPGIESDKFGNAIPTAYRTKQGSCVYSTPDGTPACIIGRVLAKVGLPVPEYGRTVGATVALNNSASYAITVAAAVAQSYQDTGSNWGKVLRVFEESYYTTTH